jgi:arylsulfatase A
MALHLDHMGIIRLLATIVVCCSSALAVALDAGPREKPNILIILADDLGYGDVQCYNPQRGKIPTPHIDRLAAGGMRFTDGHSSAGGCTPSRYALLTGRHDVRNRMEGVGIFTSFGGPPLIPPERLTIASFAKQHGYRTACIGKWHVGWNWPINKAERGLLGIRTVWEMGDDYQTPSVTPEQLAAWKNIFSRPIGGGPTALGFDTFYGIDMPGWPPFCFIDDDRPIGIPSKFLSAKDLERDVSLAASQGPAIAGWDFVSVLPDMEKQACESIAELAGSNQPFLMYLPLPSPHHPWAVGTEWRGKSGLGTYADWVMQTDAAVGKVLAALESSGAAGNTLVFFSSDNGFSGTSATELTKQGHYSSGPFRGLKGSPYEGGHRVPFIVRWPGVVQPGSVCGQLAQQTDMLATMADILGAKVPDNAGEDSVSLLPLFKGTEKPVREHAINSSGQGAYALRQRGWKLIVDTEEKLKTKVQLYNLDEDLAEKHDLVSREPGRVAEMQALLERIVFDGRSTPGPKQPNDGKLKRFLQAD